MDGKTASRKKVCRTESKDRISNLLESILSHILSRLPTEDAVRTSVLSRRWEYKWTSIYNLSFDDKRRYYTYRRRKPCKKADFINFVDRLLAFCKSSTVKKFQLSCLDKFDPSRVKTWITTALSCNVSSLQISYTGNLLLPRRFFNCDSLTKLELNLCNFKIQDRLFYSNLHTLNLSKVEIQNDNSLRSVHLLFTLPALEVFLSSGSKWRNVKVHRGGEVGFLGHKLMGEFSAFIISLEVSTDLVELLAHTDPPYPLPIFSKLTHLKVYSARKKIECAAALIHFLKTAPVLESLTFDGNYSSKAADDYENIELMSGDFLSRLEVVKLEYRYDRPVNHPLVKFLLQNAVVLKELLICSKYRVYKRDEVETRLLRFPRRSSHIAILSF